jgi:hypothetical protein
MGFGNEDLIDKRNRDRIRVLEARNRELEAGLRNVVSVFRRATSVTQNGKAQAIADAQRVLDG